MSNTLNFCSFDQPIRLVFMRCKHWGGSQLYDPTYNNKSEEAHQQLFPIRTRESLNPARAMPIRSIMLMKDQNEGFKEEE